MFSSIFNFLFGCSHQRTTFPLTPGRRSGVVNVRSVEDMRRSTYVVCLDCGKEFSYNWDQMRVGVTLPRQCTQTQVQEAVE